MNTMNTESRTSFANAVNTAAAGATTGCFGPRKVFIAALWRAAFTSEPLWAFKARLIAAHRAGTVVLARADLVGAMDTSLVRDSEATDGLATYHFVERSAVIL
jgi:hypothetical protein